MRHPLPLAALLALSALSAGCDDGRTETDAGRLDAGTSDAGGPIDAGGDSGAVDSGASDSGASDGGSIDSGPVDAGAVDAGPLVDAGPDPVADTCETAVDVTGGGTFVGTTEGATDTYSISGDGCPAGGLASSYDVAYVVSPAVSTDYRVRLTAVPGPSCASATCGNDAACECVEFWLWASEDCAADGCSSFARDANPLEITFTADGVSPMFIVVEGALFNDAGPYVLEVTPL